MRKSLNNKISIFLILILLIIFVGCKNPNNHLNSKKPITIDFWHVYGEETSSPIDQYITTFNETIGKEKGIVINVTLMSNAKDIGSKLKKAMNNEPGAPDMPDLFTCHTSDAQNLGVENLINWYDYFSPKELSTYEDDFINEGLINDNFSVFPVTKSTFVITVANGEFKTLLNKYPEISEKDLATWDGFFKIANTYYNETSKPFCAFDYLIRCMELNAYSKANEILDLYNTDGWYNDNPIFKNSFYQFIEAILNGSIIISDQFSNIQVLTGEVISGIGSSASILYYKDTITYPNGQKVPTNLKVYQLPQSNINTAYNTIAGVGFCGYKTTEKKHQAIKTFIKWFTDVNINLEFAKISGYMPVQKEAFEKIIEFDFKESKYTYLYEALNNTKNNSTFVAEPTFKNYYAKVDTFNNYIKEIQKQIIRNEILDKENLIDEIYQYFLNIR